MNDDRHQGTLLLQVELLQHDGDRSSQPSQQDGREGQLGDKEDNPRPAEVDTRATEDRQHQILQSEPALKVESYKTFNTGISSHLENADKFFKENLPTEETMHNKESNDRVKYISIHSINFTSRTRENQKEGNRVEVSLVEVFQNLNNDKKHQDKVPVDGDNVQNGREISLVEDPLQQGREECHDQHHESLNDGGHGQGLMLPQHRGDQDQCTTHPSRKSPDQTPADNLASQGQTAAATWRTQEFLHCFTQQREEVSSADTPWVAWQFAIACLFNGHFVTSIQY
jgi:hypothetical protein